MELLDPREQMTPDPRLRVVGSALVRVFPVREVHDLLEREREALGKRLPVGEPGGDRGLVGRGRRERLCRELSPALARHLAVRRQRVQDLAIALGPAERNAVREVLRGRAEHRGTADVDHLDGLLLADAPAPRDLAKGVEVDADEVERADPVLVERGHVLAVVATRQDRGVDPRMQRLHTPVQQLRELGQLFDGRHDQALLAQVVGRPAARDELDPEAGEPPREVGDPRLVVDREKCPLDHATSSRTTRGSNWCSAACTRAFSVETVSPACTGTRSKAITGPESTPSST